MTTTNEHTERAELIKGLRDLAEIDFDNLFMRAAAMLEAQRPALRPLTDEQIDAVDCVRYDEHDEVDKASIRDFARAIIAEFCRINGITGEAQPAEQAKGQEAVAYRYICGGRPHNDDPCPECEPYTTPPAQPAKSECQTCGANTASDNPATWCACPKAAQPAREWVGLTNQRTRELITDYFDAYWAINKATGLLEQFESELREKNAGLPAADDKAGGEPVTGRDLFVAWWDGYGMQPGVECSIPVWKYQETAIQSAWNHVATRYYPNPQPQAEVRVPDGYVLVPVEPTDDMLNCAQDRVYSLFRVDACSIWDAMLAAAPKPKDDLPTILKKQAS